MTESPFIVGIGGTSRPDSSSERAVRRALSAAELMGCRTRMFDGPFITALPLYSPERAERSAAECTLVAAVRECDGIIIGSPGYHGSISGPVKNAIDLLEDMAQDDRIYLDGRAFGGIVTVYGWQAGGTAMVTLRSIAHALRAWPTPYGAVLNASTPLFGPEGDCLDARTEEQLGMVAKQVVDFARWRAASIALATKNDSLASV